jgi:hypothetical protein
MRTGGFCGGRVPGYGAGLQHKSPVGSSPSIEERALKAFRSLPKKDQVAVRLRFGDRLVDWFRVYHRSPEAKLFGD